MPLPAVCPACREELDIPDALRGRPVRCAACQTTFTPPVDDDVPAVTRRPEPRDDPRDDGDFDRDDRPSRRTSAGRRPPQPRRSFLWLWLFGFGAVGMCCLGCGGLAFIGFSLNEPRLRVQYQSADGRFQAAFPGPVTPGTKVAGEGNAIRTTTTVEHQRKFLGQPFDRYFVHSTDLKVNVTKATADRLAKKAADELAARPGSTVRQSVPTADGPLRYEVDVAHGDKEATVARVYIVGDRLYVVGVTGQMLDPEQQARVHDFWDSFKLTGRDAPDKPAKKGEPAENEE